LRQHLPELGSCAEQTLEQLGLYKSDMAPEVVHLQPNTPTLLAYKQLADAGVTGAPVVSTDGRLIANLSISDIR
jgi:CBS domain-containing protein